MAYIKSVQIGKIALLGKKGATTSLEKECKSAFDKNIFKESIFIVLDEVQEDEIADRKHHGGKEKAVFANSYENYGVWKSFLGREELPFGALGENLTISGLDEKSVNVGDIHSIGTTLLQVSQPRKPCFKISKRWQNKHFTKEIFKTKKTGWYYRVLEPGRIRKNDTIKIIKKDEVALSIFEINSAFYDPKNTKKEFYEKFAKLTSITKSWHKDMEKILQNSYDKSYMDI